VGPPGFLIKLLVFNAAGGRVNQVPHDPFNAFIQLVQFDQKTQSYQKEYEAVHAEITTLEERVQSLEKEKKIHEQQIAALKKKVDALELEMRSIDEQERIKKSQLDTVDSVKQYQSLTAEVAIIRENKERIEHELLQAWDTLEEGKKQYTAFMQTLYPTLTALQTTHVEKQTVQAQLHNTVLARTAQRTELVQGIPEEWLEKYHMMQAQVPNPVVTVERDSCAACSWVIPQGDLQRLQKRAILLCKGCYRLLYIQPNHSIREKSEA
jgi:predicted  nucleic acid-binding Zn-ribbon protein